MGRLPRGNRKYQIQELWDVHHEIVRRLVLGQKSVDIAEDLNVTPALVSYTKNSTLVQRQLEIVRGARDGEMLDAVAEIHRLVPKALELYETTLDSEESPLHLRLKVAQDLLDREVPRKQRIESVHAFLTGEQIADLKSRAKQTMNFIEGEVIDAS